MAIQTVKEKISLRLEFDGGVVNGKQKIHPKSFTQINISAEDEALLNTANVLASLQDRNLLRVKKIETTDLIQG